MIFQAKVALFRKHGIPKSVLPALSMATTSPTDKDFLEYVIKAIVDHPQDVKVDRRVDEMGVLLTLKTHPEDMGEVIGRRGATANAVRTLLRIVGLKQHARVNLKIEEPEGGYAGRRMRSGPAAPASAEDVASVVEELKEDKGKK